METEYEATFTNVIKDDIRSKLTFLNADLIKPEFMQKRVVFHLPSGHEIKGAWMRVRDEGDKTTMSLKIVDGDHITDQKEICIGISDFKLAVELLKTIGCEEKAFQESKRELWKLNDVEITIDEWPFLEPFVEIEGPSEEKVRDIADKMGFEWEKAKFCAVGTLYAEKYSMSENVINNDTPRIVFDMENPFENR